MARRHQDTCVEEGKSLIHLNGSLNPKVRATGVGSHLKIAGQRVSVPTHWSKQWHAPVEALVYPTNTDQLLVVEMKYLDARAAAKAADEYKRKRFGYDNGGHFSIAEDVERGNIEMGKKVYQLYG